MSEEILATEQRRDRTEEPDVLREVFEGSYRRWWCSCTPSPATARRRRTSSRRRSCGRRAAGRRFLKVENHEAWLRTAADQPAPQPLAQDAQLLEDPPAAGARRRTSRGSRSTSR